MTDETTTDTGTSDAPTIVEGTGGEATAVATAAPKRKLPPGGARAFIAMAMAAIGGVGADNLAAMEAYDADRARRQTPRHAPRQHHQRSYYQGPPPAPTTDEDGHALEGTSRSKIGNETIRAAREKRERKAAKLAAASKTSKGESS